MFSMRMGMGLGAATSVSNQVATPVCALASGTYTEQKVIAFADITCATPGATIYVKEDDGEWTEWVEE